VPVVEASSAARLGWWTIVTYNVPTVGIGYMFLLVNIYLMKFATDVLLVPAAAMGMIFGVSRIWDAITAILTGNLPPAGSVIGADTTVCDDCDRRRTEKKIRSFKRTWEVQPDPDTCLLEQGLVCCGIATRAGCGALCPQVNQPCIGCYGPNEGVDDIGARLISALSSVIDSQDPDEIDRIIEEGIPDPIGTFYRFGLAGSLLRQGAVATKE